MRATPLLSAMLSGLLLCGLAAGALATGVLATDFLPQDHGLRYTGREERTPVTVEITLRERPGGRFEYTRWVTPTGWSGWFRKPTRTQARLQYDDELLTTLDLNENEARLSLPPGLPPGTLDALSIRLRARGDIARGVRQAEYSVWNGGDDIETWTLSVSGAETVETPDGRYESLRFRLGSEHQWIEGWSTPLLLFHFVKIVSWQDGRQTGELLLEDKQF